MKPAYEIKAVKENLDLSVALIQAVQDEKLTPKELFWVEDIFVAFAVNENAPDHAELTRRVANQARAAFSFSVIQTQRSLERLFVNEPIEEENPDLQAARSIMFLLNNAVSPDLFAPVWNCPPQYRREFEVRPVSLSIHAAELHGKGLTWDDVGGLPQFLDLLGYLAGVVEDLPEVETPLSIAETVPVTAAMTVAAEISLESPPETQLDALSESIVEKSEWTAATPPPAETIGGPVSRFISEQCDLGRDIRTTAKELYDGFLEWCRETGQDDVSQRSFGMQLTAIGLYRRRRGRGKHWWEGIRLKVSTTKVASVSLESTNGHREGYQTELPQ
ncbi:MAG: hypothetical protein O2913_05295 [Chloroflexi bacterium]|nr:hypothetical protein [Chloroflexota bacterium]